MSNFLSSGLLFLSVDALIEIYDDLKVKHLPGD